MRDLTQHLTTRADDNHAPPVSSRASSHGISTALDGCQDLVRFFALLRIKPHAPLLVRVPVNSFEFQPCGTPSIHRLQRGLPGYLILFAPHAFAPQRQFQSRKPPSPLVFLPISTHFTATPVIPLSSPALQPASIQSTSHLESRTFTPDLAGRLRALYAQSFRTTLAPYVLPRLLARS